MPLYQYQCPDVHKFERILPLVRYDEPQNCPTCGQPAQKLVAAPAVRGDYAPYQCPVTGKMIEGRRAHIENLARHNCRILEPGEKEEAMRRRRASEEALENSVAETAAKFVAELPSEKREKLASELSHGIDVSIERAAA